MSFTISSLYPLFKPDQLNTLSIWGAMRPVGLGIRIATDYDYFPQAAMLYRRDRQDVRYIICPEYQRRVVLIQSEGEKWEMPTLETALGKVVSMEQRNASA